MNKTYYQLYKEAKDEAEKIKKEHAERVYKYCLIGMNKPVLSLDGERMIVIVEAERVNWDEIYFSDEITACCVSILKNNKEFGKEMWVESTKFSNDNKFVIKFSTIEPKKNTACVIC